MYDVIVIGAGAMGSATAWHLARDGRRVLLLEQYEFAHTRGSSHGESRIFRFAYVQSQYARFAMQCKPIWRELEADAGATLLREVGGLDLADDAHGFHDLDAVEHALASNGARYERLDRAQLAARFPQWNLGPDGRAVFSPDAGSLDATQCVQAMIRRAAAHGAEVRDREPVTSVRADGAGVEVVTPRGSYRARKLVVTAGAWVNHVLGQTGIQLPVKIEQEQVVYFTPSDPAAFSPGRFTIWVHYRKQHAYGFPVLGQPGMKMGFHHERQYIDVDNYAAVPRPQSIEACRAYVRKHLPGADGPTFGATACLYTTTPDEDFVIDVHPHLPNVIIGSPCSGHGFKFAVGVGRALADLALQASTTMNVGHCKIDRLLGPRAGLAPGDRVEDADDLI